MTEFDHYKTLGISYGATDQEIKDAYRRLARESHPDILPDQSPKRAFAEETIRKLNAAWETLSDPQRRLEYDRRIGNDSLHARRRVLIGALRNAVENSDLAETFRAAQELYLHFPDDSHSSDAYAESCCALARAMSLEGNDTAALQRLRRAAGLAKDAGLKRRLRMYRKELKSRRREHARFGIGQQIKAFVERLVSPVRSKNSS